MRILDLAYLLFRPRRVPWVCRFSERNPEWDLHDYHYRCGGDGYPDHFRTYRCHRCGKSFTI